MERFSFQRGLNEAKGGDADTIKAEIIELLQLKSKSQWYQRLNGHVEPKVSEKEGIEEIFVKYGVKKSKIWGTTVKIPC